MARAADWATGGRAAHSVCLMIGLALARAAVAQPVSDHPAGASPDRETHLHIAAEGSVSVLPDQLVADLLASATNASAAAAQRKVNELMATGLRQAHEVSNVEARAVGYAVRPADEPVPEAAPARPRPSPRWTAEQTLELRSGQGEALLDLAGRLQALGFAATSIGWQLSPEAERKARDSAMVEALHALRDRAAAAAEALGMHVGRFQDVQVEAPSTVPFRPMMAVRAMVAAPPPAATKVAEPVTSQVSADIVLAR